VERGEGGGAGKYVKLQHEGGFESLYLHLDAIAPGIEPGAGVKKGELIAQSGNSGRSTGPHLHFELRIAGEAVDAQKTMPIPERALGPRALREHRARINQLLTMEER